MFKDVNYKQKNRILIAGGVLLLILTWYFGVKRTLDLYDQCSALEEQLKMVSDAPARSALLEGDLKEMDNFIGNWIDNENEIQQRLLDFLTQYCAKEDIVLRELPQPSKNVRKDYSVETSIFVVEGSFNRLLKLIHELEQKNRIGKVVSVTFQSKEDYKTKRISLLATLYLQNVIRHEQ